MLGRCIRILKAAQLDLRTAFERLDGTIWELKLRYKGSKDKEPCTYQKIMTRT
jgi:hypothetical protein